MINSIISSIVCVVFLSLSSNLFFKFNRKTVSFAIVAAVLVMLKIILQVRENPNLNLVTSLCTYLVIEIFYFVGALRLKVLYVFLFVIFSSLCDIFTMKIFSLFFDVNVLTNSFTFILSCSSTICNFR